MLTLYAHPASSNARKVMNQLAYMALDHTFEHVALEKGAQFQPDFLALNPNAKVPVLTHDQLTIWESGAIGRYLARPFDRQDLLGGDEVAAQTQVDQWLFWQAAHLSPTCATINFTRVIAPMLGVGDGEDNDAVHQAIKTLDALNAVVENTLTHHPMLVGESITLADIFVASTYAFAPNMRAELPTQIERWLDRLTEQGAITR